MSELLEKVHAAFEQHGWSVKPLPLDNPAHARCAVMDFDTAVGLKEASALIRLCDDGVVRLAYAYESEGRNLLESVWPNSFSGPEKVDEQISQITRDVVSRVDGSYARGLLLSRMRQAERGG